MGQNNQKYGLKYWAIRWFTRSLRLLPRSWESEGLDDYGIFFLLFWRIVSCYIPVHTIFVLGVSWGRINETGAFWGLMVSRELVNYAMCNYDDDDDYDKRRWRRY